jgi:hypothetical protein
LLIGTLWLHPHQKYSCIQQTSNVENYKPEHLVKYFWNTYFIFFSAQKSIAKLQWLNYTSYHGTCYTQTKNQPKTIKGKPKSTSQNERKNPKTKIKTLINPAIFNTITWLIHRCFKFLLFSTLIAFCNSISTQNAIIVLWFGSKGEWIQQREKG